MVEWTWPGFAGAIPVSSNFRTDIHVVIGPPEAVYSKDVAYPEYYPGMYGVHSNLLCRRLMV